MLIEQGDPPLRLHDQEAVVGLAQVTPAICLVQGTAWILGWQLITEQPGLLHGPGAGADSRTGPPEGAPPLHCVALRRHGARSWTQIAQGPPAGPTDRLEEPPLIAEPHFPRGGVNVHVHFAWVAPDIENRQGMAPH